MEVKLDKVGTVEYIAVLGGAINWGTTGLFNVNLVTTLFSSMPILIQLAYLGIFVSGIHLGWKFLMKK